MFDIDFSEAIVKFSDFEFSQLGDALVFGASMLAIGMITVLSVLCILWLCLVIFKLVFHDLPKRKKAKRKAAPITPMPEQIIPASYKDDSEIVAVIAAAIAMAENDNSGVKFRVVSFKRV